MEGNTTFPLEARGNGVVFTFPQIQGLCLLSPLQIQGTPDLEALWFPPALFHFLRITCHCVKQLISSEFACFSLSPHGHFREFEHPEGRRSLGLPFSCPSVIPELGTGG